VKLVNNLKELRKSDGLNLTQEELAFVAGIGRQRMNEIENGEIPSAIVMLKIACFFDKDPREIWRTDFVVYTLQDIFTRRANAFTAKNAIVGGGEQ